MRQRRHGHPPQRRRRAAAWAGAGLWAILLAAPATAQPPRSAPESGVLDEAAAERQPKIVLPAEASPRRRDFGLAAIGLTAFSALGFLGLLGLEVRRRRRRTAPSYLTRAFRAAGDISRLCGRREARLRRIGRTAGRLVGIAGNLDAELEAARRAARAIPLLSRPAARAERARLISERRRTESRLRTLVERLEETATNLELLHAGWSHVADLERTLADLEPAAACREAPDLRLIA